MLLTEKRSGLPVEILELEQLFSLFEPKLLGRYKAGDELGFTDVFNKTSLTFTSGEDLPQCWLDPHYRDDELRHIK